MFKKVEGIYVFLRIKLTEGSKVCKVDSWMLSFGRGVSSWEHVDNDWYLMGEKGNYQKKKKKKKTIYSAEGIHNLRRTVIATPPPCSVVPLDPYHSATSPIQLCLSRTS
jgi:hypothetical protein